MNDSGIDAIRISNGDRHLRDVHRHRRHLLRRWSPPSRRGRSRSGSPRRPSRPRRSSCAARRSGW
ncbi:MAG: hypothetical protein HC772_16560 [Leptolyngbyaceae cyanobacterium CRU_2_3]|nr:hypothetical protein [Leptolyngbyaceae cyanobacterium CRU_2_3]